MSKRGRRRESSSRPAVSPFDWTPRHNYPGEATAVKDGQLKVFQFSGPETYESEAGELLKLRRSFHAR